MGGSSSKVSRGARSLPKTIPRKPNGPSSVNSTRPGAEGRHAEETMNPDSDANVAKRMQELGPVQFKQTNEKYVPASEEAFTLTLEARKKQEEQGTVELEQSGPKRLLPSITITAILRSLQEGDSPESVVKTYQLDPSVLPRLSKLSIPYRPPSEGANQLIQDAPQQPVRRRKREPRN